MNEGTQMDQNAEWNLEIRVDAFGVFGHSLDRFTLWLQFDCTCVGVCSRVLYRDKTAVALQMALCLLCHNYSQWSCKQRKWFEFFNQFHFIILDDFTTFSNCSVFNRNRAHIPSLAMTTTTMFNNYFKSVRLIHNKKEEGKERKTKDCWKSFACVSKTISIRCL